MKVSRCLQILSKKRVENVQSKDASFRIILSDGLFHFRTVDRICRKIQALFSGSLEYISADFTHLSDSFLTLVKIC